MAVPVEGLRFGSGSSLCMNHLQLDFVRLPLNRTRALSFFIHCICAAVFSAFCPKYLNALKR